MTDADIRRDVRLMLADGHVDAAIFLASCGGWPIFLELMAELDPIRFSKLMHAAEPHARLAMILQCATRPGKVPMSGNDTPH